MTTTTSTIAATAPRLGLVCITIGPDVRYRTITRTRLLALGEAGQETALRSLYRDNLSRLYGALAFCYARGIKLYRVTSNLFPQIDRPLAKQMLDELKGPMAAFGPRAEQLGIRVVLHPDQFVVLSSESGDVVGQSVAIMQDHALVFDRLGLPRSPWSCMILHGGKAGRADALVAAIRQLPEPVRSRLVLENDERAYSAEEILSVCRSVGLPMVFDAHHHLIREQLDSYEHESIRRYTKAARETWPDPAWQIVHLSNGRDSFRDPRHSDLITAFPSAFRDVPWLEVEAKGKEQAIENLQKQLLQQRST